MKLKTASVSYEFKDGLARYSNHSASVVLNFEIEEEDLENLPALKARIRHAQRIAEDAVAESIARTRPSEPEPEPAEEEIPPGPPARRWEPEALPPASARQGPPPPAAPAATQTGGADKRYGPPKNAKTFAGWINGAGKDHKERALEICRNQGYSTWFRELTDDQAMWIYHQLTVAPAVQPPWGGHPAGGNGNGAYGRH